MAHHPRLVLVCPRVKDPSELLPVLSSALSGGRVDAVVLPLPDVDDRAAVKFAKGFAAPVQAAGAALLLQDRFDLVARAGADGVHLSDPAALSEALETLRPQERIVGCAGLRARHDAMEAAELGADYVTFGEPYPDGPLPPLSAVTERAAWWAELFQTPCVAYAAAPEAFEALAKTAAEFVAAGPWILSAAEGPEAAVRKALAILAAHPLPAD
jgi:thiamine-phosphate pyrophosphorylase